jgi:hypothetical protein
MKKNHKGNCDGQCGECEVLKKAKMQEVIKRLKRECEESRQQWFKQGKENGLDFAKNAHYMTLQQAISWKAKDENFGERLEKTWGEVKVEGDDILPKLRAQLGVRDFWSLDDSPMFYNWARGFMESIVEFWNEVSPKV